MLNKLKRKRFLFLSPTVQSGIERESKTSDFNIVQKLGRGAFGNVFKAQHKKTKKVYAIKEIEKKKIIDGNMLDQVRLETKIMYLLNHKNIIGLYNHFETDLAIYLVLDEAWPGWHDVVVAEKGWKDKLPPRATTHKSIEIVPVEYLYHAPQFGIRKEDSDSHSDTDSDH